MKRRTIMTVKGPIDADKAGVCLPHEHVFVDLRFAVESTSTEKVKLSTLSRIRDNYLSLPDNLLLSSIPKAIAELSSFAEYGGSTLVDLGCTGLVRRPRDLREVSEKSGVAIVVATGYYIKQSLGPETLGASEAELTARIVSEFENGIGSSGIRPGIIGEIGIGPVMEDWERKVIRAVSAAQRETGLSVSYHIQAVPVLRGFTQPNGLEVVKLVEAAGGDLSRTVMGHSDAQIDMRYLEDLLSTGVYVEFDHFGKAFYFVDTNFTMASDTERVEALAELVVRGHLERLLVSQDICVKSDLRCFGGHGYSHILRNIVPMMKNNGIDEDQIARIMGDNVRALLSADF